MKTKRKTIPFQFVFCLFCFGFLLFFCSCRPSVKNRGAFYTTPQRDSALVAVDSLMWLKPDSALTMLISYFDTEAGTAFDRHYAHLLLSELLYKNDYEQTNRNALLHAVDYFDSICGRDALNASPANTFLDARAHYIKGVGYYERDSVVEACQEYLKAVEIMESRFPTVETMCTSSPHVPRFMALTYNRLGELFSGQYMMEPSIYCYENALVFCEIEPTSSTGVANTLYRIGNEYDKKKETDIARQYYEQALGKMPDTNSLSYRDLVSLLAFSDYELGLGKEQSLHTLEQVLADADNTDEKLTRCFTIGSIFFEEGIYDSAMFYLEPVFEHSGKKPSIIQAADYLRMIHDSIGENEKSDAYARFLSQQKEPEGQNMILVSQLESLFQNYINSRQKKQTAYEKHDVVLWIGVLIVLSILVVISLVIFVIRHGKKKQESHQENGVNPIILMSQQKAFMEEPVCKHILEVCDKEKNTFKSNIPVTEYLDIALDDKQKAKLMEALLRHYGTLFEKLKSQYPRLNSKDLLYCSLRLLGLNNIQISVMTQINYRTTWEREKRLQALFGTGDEILVFLMKYIID